MLLSKIARPPRGAFNIAKSVLCCLKKLIDFYLCIVRQHSILSLSNNENNLQLISQHPYKNQHDSFSYSNFMRNLTI